MAFASQSSPIFDGNTVRFNDIDVPVEATVDANGNGTATRETGFNINFSDVAVESLNTGAIANDAEFVSEALAGNLYFNIHTNDFPSGEIRGQIDTVVSDETVDGVRTITLTADLDASQEPGPTSDSLATGSATVTIVVDTFGNATYSVDLDVNGLAASDLLPVAGFSPIHLHNAPAGVNGPVIVDVVQDAGGDVTGANADGNIFDEVEEGFGIEFQGVAVESLNTAAIADDSEFVSEALAGNLYFNIHTEDFPGGEIRGQIDTVVSDETVGGIRTIILEADLDASQEPGPFSDSDATGTARVIITVDAQGNASYSVDLDVAGIASDGLLPVAGVSSIHIHNAPAGVNGPVILDVVQDAGGDVNGDTATGTVFADVEEGFGVEFEDVAVDSLNIAAIADDAAFVEEALAGNIYFNIHTEDFPAGEIRGQLDTVVSDETVDGVRTIVLSAALDASQEPGPTSDSDATGTGTVTIVVDADGNATYSVDLDVVGIATDSLLPVAGISSIHLHNAPAGVNGPVILDVIQDAGGDVTGAGGDVFNEAVQTIDLNGVTNIVGSDDGDRLVANGAAANTIEGGDGDDFIAGGGGTDVLDGGAGNDTNSFFNIGVGVTASLEDGTATYQPNPAVTINEVFTNFENLDGTNAADNFTGDDGDNVLTGNGGADTLLGGDGDDTLAGGGGTDVIDGGSGNDTNSFADINFGVTANLNSERAVYVTPNGVVVERFSNIENLDGSEFNDRLTGDSGDNVLSGNGGNDVLRGIGGNDDISGGAGNDAVFAGSGNDTIDGGLGDDRLFARNGNDEIDAGSGDDFVVAGNGNDNVALGSGDDFVFGGNGNDTIDAGAGDDVLFGGAGNDVFVFADEDGDNVVRDFGRRGGNDVIDLEAFDFASFDAVLGRATQDGRDVVIALDGDTSVTLENTSLNSLEASDFLL